jgi:hypothetical protein
MNPAEGFVLEDSVKNRRTSFEHGGLNPALPLLRGSGASDQNRFSTVKQHQASMVVQWIGPTYFGSDGRPLYYDDLIYSRTGKCDDKTDLKSPKIWIAPMNISTPSLHGKWKVKRVWNLSDYDEYEQEFVVGDEGLVDKVKELVGVPVTQTFKGTGHYDPTVKDWQVKTVYDIDGEIKEMACTKMLNEDGLILEFGTVIDDQLRLFIEDTKEERQILPEPSSKYGSVVGSIPESSNKDSASGDDNKSSVIEGECNMDVPQTQNEGAERFQASWGYRSGGLMDNVDDGHDFVPVQKKQEINSTQEKYGDKSALAKWGYGEGPNDMDNQENELTLAPKRSDTTTALPSVTDTVLLQARENTLEQDIIPGSAQNSNEDQNAHARWVYGKGCDGAEREKNELSPVQMTLSLLSPQMKESSVEFPKYTLEDAQSASKLFDGPPQDTETLYIDQEFAAKEAAEKILEEEKKRRKEKKKKRKKKQKEEDEMSIFDLLDAPRVITFGEYSY